jgi:hypothetical protein
MVGGDGHEWSLSGVRSVFERHAFPSFGNATNEREFAELMTAERGARHKTMVMSGASRE